MATGSQWPTVDKAPTPAAWSAEEDAFLTQLCLSTRGGDWGGKAQLLMAIGAHTPRTPDAVRVRWSALKKATYAPNPEEARELLARRRANFCGRTSTYHSQEDDGSGSEPPSPATTSQVFNFRSSQVWTPADDALLRSIHPEGEPTSDWNSVAERYNATKAPERRERTASAILNRHCKPQLTSKPPVACDFEVLSKRLLVISTPSLTDF